MLKKTATRKHIPNTFSRVLDKRTRTRRRGSRTRTSRHKWVWAGALMRIGYFYLWLCGLYS